MVLILNLFYIGLIAAILWAAYMAFISKPNSWPFKILTIMLTLALAILINAPSYLPKPGQPERTQLEQFEQEELEMQDSLRKPAKTDAQREEALNKKLNAVEQATEK